MLYEVITRTRQNADLDVDRTDRLVVATVDAGLALDHTTTDDFLLELAESVLDDVIGPLSAFAAQRCHGSGLGLADRSLALLLVGNAIGI